MNEFFRALANPDLAFLRLALILGLLASVPFGVIGSFVVARRISYMAAAISHCLLGGIGAAYFAQARLGWTWFEPLHGALVAALASALIIGAISLSSAQREDTVIGAVWVIGMGIGLLFLYKTPGYVDAMSWLWGDILLIRRSDLIVVGALAATALGLSVWFYNPLLAICFDEEFPQLRGVPVRVYFLLLLVLTAMTVALMVKTVGIVMVIALLTLPAAVAGAFARRLWAMMALAVAACALFTTGGLAVSYTWNLPSGPSIILLAGAIYLAVATGRRLIPRRRDAPERR